MSEDLADRLDDLICAWDKVVGTELDTVVLLLLGWLGFGAVIFLISHLIYSTLGTVEDDSYSSPAHIPTYQPLQSQSNNVNPSLSPPDLVPTMSSSPPLHPSLPEPVGSDPDCVAFVTTCLDFFNSNAEVRDDILTRWREKLSEFARRSSQDEGLLIEFVSILDCSTAPTLSNLTVSSLPSNNMTVSSDLSTTISFLLRTSRPVRDSMVSVDYVLTIDRIRARLSATFITDEHLIIAKFEGWPEIKMRLSPVESQSAGSSKECMSISEVVEDVAAQAIRGVQLDIRTNTIKNFPVFKRKVFPNRDQKKTKSLFGRGGSRPHSAEVCGIGSSSARQMEVKIVKATQLGGLTGNCVEPYVVLEVDEPSQRHQTCTRSGAVSGWDETFTIDITKHTSELLFEVWDQGQTIGQSDAFLGLAIVSVSELMVTASQRHVIPLQGRPYEEDKVTGLLTIEFLAKDTGMMLEDKDLMPGVHRTFEAKQSQHIDGTKILKKKTVYSLQEPQIPDADKILDLSSAKETSDKSDLCADRTQADVVSVMTRRESYLRATRFSKTDLLTGSSVADMALKDININKTRGSTKQPTKSMMVMHSVQTIGSSQINNGDSTTTSSYTEDASDSIGEASITSRDSDFNKYQRGRRPKRNLISTIKKRFTGTRSLSSSGLDPPQPTADRETHLKPGDDRVRSVSEHRAENSGHERDGQNDTTSHSSDTDSGCSLSLPSWRGSLSLSWQSDGYLSPPNQDDGSSMSDVSGISTSSNKTFVSEESSLVLETLEDGRHHHYLIPIQAARRGKFKKGGTKLHIYMDHIFTAQHTKLGSSCQACNRLIPLRLGKQAYVCRDCGVTTHKQCHAKVETHCQYTSLPSLELYRGSFIVKMRKSRFGIRRRLKSKGSGSIASLSEYKSKFTRPKEIQRDRLMTSQSLDGGKTRMPILRFRKNIFKKK